MYVGRDVLESRFKQPTLRVLTWEKAVKASMLDNDHESSPEKISDEKQCTTVSFRLTYVAWQKKR